MEKSDFLKKKRQILSKTDISRQTEPAKIDKLIRINHLDPEFTCYPISFKVVEVPNNQNEYVNQVYAVACRTSNVLAGKLSLGQIKDLMI